MWEGKLLMVFLCYAFVSLCKFLILAPLRYRFSYWHMAFQIPGTRFTLDLEELILPRVCWNPNSFSWPLWPSRVSVAAPPPHSTSLSSYHAFSPCSLCSSHISLLILCRAFCSFDLDWPSHGQLVLQVSVPCQLLKEASTDHSTSRESFLFNRPFATLLFLSSVALSK